MVAAARPLEAPMNDATWSTIHQYNRAQALADKVLVDLTPLAREAGIRRPVAITAAAWSLAIDLTNAARRAGCDRTGRAWDVLMQMREAMRQAPSDAQRLPFTVLVVRERPEPQRIKLHVELGPGDAREPVLTIMLPEES
jgi:hypothetical protein